VKTFRLISLGIVFSVIFLGCSTMQKLNPFGGDEKAKKSSNEQERVILLQQLECQNPQSKSYRTESCKDVHKVPCMAWDGNGKCAVW
jgi:hypothetical protein